MKIKILCSEKVSEKGEEQIVDRSRKENNPEDNNCVVFRGTGRCNGRSVYRNWELTQAEVEEIAQKDLETRVTEIEKNLEWEVLGNILRSILNYIDYTALVTEIIENKDYLEMGT